VSLSERFVAIDFETANQAATSACSVGLVRVEGLTIVEKKSFFIRPPTSEFLFTWLHGISWDDVKNQPTFGELWPEIEPFFKNVDYAVAHNAGFDRNVLNACCQLYSLNMPSVEFNCTVKLARKVWGIFPTKLSNVCKTLDIPLNHHEALSDAEACAKIVIAARKSAGQPTQFT